MSSLISDFFNFVPSSITIATAPLSTACFTYKLPSTSKPLIATNIPFGFIFLESLSIISMFVFKFAFAFTPSIPLKIDFNSILPPLLSFIILSYYIINSNFFYIVLEN